jgi:hypothetical protein
MIGSWKNFGDRADRINCFKQHMITHRNRIGFFNTFQPDFSTHLAIIPAAIFGEHIVK